MKQMCKKKSQSPCVCRNKHCNPRCLTKSELGRASFTDYIKATRGTTYTGVAETKCML